MTLRKNSFLSIAYLASYQIQSEISKNRLFRKQAEDIVHLYFLGAAMRCSKPGDPGNNNDEFVFYTIGNCSIKNNFDNNFR